MKILNKLVAVSAMILAFGTSSLISDIHELLFSEFEESYPKYELSDILYHVDFYDSYGNLGLRVDPEGKTLMYIHKDEFGLITYKYFQMELQNLGENVIEFHFVPKKNPDADSLGRFEKSDQKINYERAYRDFMKNYIPPYNVVHQEIRGIWEIDHVNKVRYHRDLITKRVIKIERYQIEYRDDRIIYRVETEIPDDAYVHDIDDSNLINSSNVTNSFGNRSCTFHMGLADSVKVDTTVNGPYRSGSTVRSEASTVISVSQTDIYANWVTLSNSLYHINPSSGDEVGIGNATDRSSTGPLTIPPTTSYSYTLTANVTGSYLGNGEYYRITNVELTQFSENDEQFDRTYISGIGANGCEVAPHTRVSSWL